MYCQEAIYKNYNISAKVIINIEPKETEENKKISKTETLATERRKKHDPNQ